MRNLLFILILTTILYTACEKEVVLDSEEVSITLTSELIQNIINHAVIISNQEGEILDGFLFSEVNSAQDLVITVNKMLGDILSLTIIKESPVVPFDPFNPNEPDKKTFKNTTYTHLQDGTLIDQYSFQSVISTFDSLDVIITGINNLDTFRVDAPNSMNLSYSYENNALNLKFNKSGNADAIVLVKANGEDNYRYYYYSGSDSFLEIDFEEMEENPLEYKVQMPEIGEWLGYVIAKNTETGKYCWLYNVQIWQGETKWITLYLPNNMSFTDYDFSLTNASPYGMGFHQRFEALPTQIPKLNFDHVVDSVTTNGYSFQNMGQGDYYRMKYLFNSEVFINEVHFVSSWEIIGRTEADIAFTFPTLPPSIVSDIPSLSYLNAPHSCQLKIVKKENITSTIWLEPYHVFEREWQLANGGTTSKAWAFPL